MRRFVYIIILALAVLGIASIVFCISIENELSIDTIRFLVRSDVGDQSISITKKDDGKYYLFLPAYATGENTNLSIPSGQISIDGKRFCNKDFLENIDFDSEHILSIYDEKPGETYKVSFMQSDSVPTMYITTACGDYLNCEDKEKKETCQIALIQTDGTVDYSRKNNTIRGHGNATWSHKKRPYNIYLECKSNLLGLGNAYEWVLLANAYDNSNIRNKFIYDFAELVGLDFSPHSDWVDLYVDGSYRGLYLLSEKNIKGTDQIDIPDNGCIFEMTISERLLGAENELLTRLGTPLYVNYPKVNETDNFLEKLAVRLDAFEKALETDTTIDKLREQIDICSWVKHYLIDEIVFNQDASRISQYFYMLGDTSTERIYAGPVWDYDLTMRPLMDVNEPEKFLCGIRNYNEQGAECVWLSRLYANDAFYSEIINTYQKEVRESFLAALEKLPRCYLEKIRKSAKMNAILWETGDCLSSIESLIDFEKSRIRFLDSLWMTAKPYYFVWLSAEKYITDICFEGETYVPRSINNDSFTGWYFDKEFTNPCNEPFVPNENVALYARFEEQRHTKLEDTKATNFEDPRFLELIKDPDELLYPIIVIIVFSVFFAAVVLADLHRNRRNHQ